LQFRTPHVVSDACSFIVNAEAMRRKLCIDTAMDAAYMNRWIPIHKKLLPRTQSAQT
jgi:hypothetical protein